ncbi:hypothetical protein Tco_0341656 [Tanacetum coccineum]
MHPYDLLPDPTPTEPLLWTWGWWGMGGGGDDSSGGVDVAMVVAAGDDGDGAWGAWFRGSGRSSEEKQFWTWPEKVAGDGGSWVVAGDGRRKTFPAVAAGK